MKKVYAMKAHSYNKRKANGEISQPESGMCGFYKGLPVYLVASGLIDLKDNIMTMDADELDALKKRTMGRKQFSEINDTTPESR